MYSNNQGQTKIELKEVIKISFEEMLQDVIRGKLSIHEFTKKVNYNYTQKKMELSGRLF